MTVELYLTYFDSPKTPFQDEWPNGDINTISVLVTHILVPIYDDSGTICGYVQREQQPTGQMRQHLANSNSLNPTIQLMTVPVKRKKNNGGIISQKTTGMSTLKGPEEHVLRTKRVLQRLHDNDLYLKLEKCMFDVNEIEYLGMIICHNQVKMDPVKLAGIKDWPTPTNIHVV
ncbi:hypothetical protein SERLA73DRAFT_80418 [Serpula lacrymans var. lacrymans S7.3]|uniref:Uncharacterized protein n=2 Tax=Serpula lacrymans var. lacrymans TaxID=341189 RepID=F8QJP1_SERL3|nr:uncharacterized protein SERLADRAFT_440705 [Serpula lacrymans var. lacrymans S7.9]EGN91479.1 hypothetical protein SERLA73DRAFT_80418 [Serpula lacrymans var. lacrymans S7.3]EGO21447.1 hypothetical protein SERLADRAFT_440705 [Serpula lacrymans var. lacrymans S7.9]